jgi:hypothetical protein
VVSPGRPGYRFGPLERRGILGPLRAGQAILLALGALLAIALLDLAPSAGGAILAVLSFACAALLVTVPICGRTLEEWTPIACSFATARVTGRTQFRSSLPYDGFRTVRDLIGDPRPVAPPTLRGVRLTEASFGDGSAGVVSELGGRRLTSVLACRVVSFALLDADAQERRLAHWGRILAGAANTAIRRVQWIERTAPAQTDEMVRWLHTERDPTIPPRGTPMVESYLELIDNGARIAQEHEILIAIQVDGDRARSRDDGAVVRSLIGETERIVRALRAAEVQVLGALGPRQLARVLRTAFDPYARSELTALEAADPGRDGLASAAAWPLGANEAWDTYETDGAVHSTYWIGAWPRVEVAGTFLNSVIGHSSVVRTIAVVFEPLAPQRSTREAEAAITRDRADSELRHRFGQSETARQRQARDDALRREQELAAGHNEVRVAGFVTVSGRDQEELRRARAEVLDHAARSRLELHCLYGHQGAAFTFTLPLCRGLR